MHDGFSMYENIFGDNQCDRYKAACEREQQIMEAMATKQTMPSTNIGLSMALQCVIFDIIKALLLFGIPGMFIQFLAK